MKYRRLLRSASIVLLLTFHFTDVQATSAKASVITITPQVAEFTPGQVFEVELAMPSMTNLFAYEVSLHLTSRTQLTVFTNCPRHQFAAFTQPPNSLYSQILAPLFCQTSSV